MRYPVPSSTRQRAQRGGNGNETTDAGGAYVGPGKEEFRDGPEALEAGFPAEPMNLGVAGDDLYARADFVEQRCAFKSALPRSDHGDLLALEPAQIRMF